MILSSPICNLVVLHLVVCTGACFHFFLNFIFLGYFVCYIYCFRLFSTRCVSPCPNVLRMQTEKTDASRSKMLHDFFSTTTLHTITLNRSFVVADDDGPQVRVWCWLSLPDRIRYKAAERSREIGEQKIERNVLHISNGNGRPGQRW